MSSFISTLETLGVGKAGHIAASSSGLSGDTLVRVVDANINAALGVTNGATPGKTCKAPTSEAEAKALLGVLIDPEFKNDINAAADYLAGQQATILEKGYIWVNAEGTVAVDDPVCVRITSDGGSNTTLGTFGNKSDYPTAGIRLTPTAANSQLYSVELSNGVTRETYQYVSDSTATAAEITAGLATAINAGSNFTATDNTGTIDIKAVNNVLEIQPTSNLAKSNPARAVFLPGYKFKSAVTGAGLAKIRVPAK